MIGLIIGPQGCGKGTQAEFIKRDYGFSPASMGNLLKAERNLGTAEGDLIKKIQFEGGLVPADITNKIAAKAIKETNKILFDGYPRSHEQADFLIENNYNIDFAIVIDVSEEETVNRLSKRRICTATEKIFIADKITQKDKEECRAKGGKIIQREDDTPRAIKKRLSLYHSETEPVVKKLANTGVPVIRINGEQSIEDVRKDIQNVLNSILKN